VLSRVGVLVAVLVEVLVDRRPRRSIDRSRGVAVSREGGGGDSLRTDYFKGDGIGQQVSATTPWKGRLD